MSKRKVEIRLHSHGIYRHWDSESKDLPKIERFTTDVPAQIGIEFGFIIHIKGAKNQQLDYCIAHPGILDDHGNVRAPFDGSVYVRTNDWKFYLGDTLWEPIDDKLGNWKLSVELNDKVIAEKIFNIATSHQSEK